MPKDYMLTVYSAGTGPRDVQVNDADDMQQAIRLAEAATGCRVDHGRSGVGKSFDPGIIIDAPTNRVGHVHDRPATESMKVTTPKDVTVARGEGRRKQ